MSNPKFTPGPWRIVQREEQDFVSKPKNVRVGPAICGVEKSTTTISIHANPDAGPCPDVEKLDAIGHANADLIAAAPDLYEALFALKQQVVELLIPALNTLPPGTGLDLPTILGWEKTVELVDNALAKARGENQPTP